MLNEARALTARIEHIRAGGAWDNQAETAAVEAAEKIARRYQRTVDAGGVGNTRALSRAVRRMLEKAQENYAGALAKWQSEIIEADGDLEGAQDSPEWRDREVLAARVQYWLNWVHYLAASRFERHASARRQWLEDALEGFSTFALQEEDLRLAAESLYGRGLTARELGRYKEAVADLKRARSISQSAGLRGRIRLALADTLLESGNYRAALAASKEIARAGAGLAPHGELLRAKTILLALKSGAVRDRSSKDKLRDEATALLGKLSSRGGTWAKKARELFLSTMNDPQEWADAAGGPFVKWLLAESLRGAGKYESALELYRRLVEEGPPAGVSKARILLASGICSYRLDRYVEAYEGFGRVLAADPPQSIRADAAYLRFKAAEALYFRERGRENADLLKAAIAGYLGGAPRHRYRFEAHYRLGELLEEEGKFLDASEAFARVDGDPRFNLKARFLAAQAVVEKLSRLWQAGQSVPQERSLIENALARIDDFREEVGRFDKLHDRSAIDQSLIVPMEVKSALMAAGLKKHEQPPDWQGVLNSLEDVGQGLSQESELLAEVLAARVEALVSLGRLGQAEEILAGLVTLFRQSPAKVEALRELGVVCLEAAQTARSGGDFKGAREATRMALSIYRALMVAADAGEIAAERARGLRSIVSQLKTELATSEAGLSSEGTTPP